MGDSAARFYVYLLTNSENSNEGLIQVELPPDALNLSEFPTREEADVFAESTAASFRNASHAGSFWL